MSAAVAELRTKYAFEVEVIKKTGVGLVQRLSLPKFPAIEIDGQVAFEGSDVTQDQLEAAIRSRQTP